MVAAAAVLLSALAAGYLLFCIYQDVQLARYTVPAQASAASQQETAQTFTLAELMTAQLFGRQQSSAAVVQQEEAAPETRLSLELKGVFSSSDSESSSALIAEKGKSAKYYRVGDQLPGGAKLDRVARSHVELRRSGRLERLSFSPPGTSFSGSSSRANRPGLSSGQPRNTNFTSRPAADQGAPRVESLRERLRQLREAQQDDGDE